MFDFFKNFYSKNLSRPEAAILILQFIAIFIIVYFFSSIFGPLLAALVLAFMLERPVSFLIKHGASRLSATTLVTTLYFAIVISIFVAVIPPALNQLGKLSQKITTVLNNENIKKQNISEIKVYSVKSTNQKTPESQNNENNTTITTTENLESTTDLNTTNTSEIENSSIIKKRDATIQWITTNIDKYIKKLPESYHNILTKEQIHDVVVYSKNQVKTIIQPLLTTQLTPFIIDTFTILMYLIIVPIFSFYMLKDKEKLLQISSHYFSNYQLVSNFWREMNKQISQYLNGKCIHVIIMSIVNGLAFWLFDLNYALILGIGVGLSVVIPYVGAVIIAIPFLLVAFFQYGFTGYTGWLIAVYIVIQLLDSYVFTPMLFSETLNLSAFSILVAIVIFGGIWGFWGVVLAIPLATFVKTIISLWPRAIATNS
jgi:putative permease